MRKILLGIIVTMMFSVGLIGGTLQKVSAEETPEITLTEEQKHEIAILQREIIDQKKEMVEKYVEYGIFTNAQGQKMISYLEKRYEKLEKNGFIPKCKRKKDKK